MWSEYDDGPVADVPLGGTCILLANLVGCLIEQEVKMGKGNSGNCY